MCSLTSQRTCFWRSRRGATSDTRAAPWPRGMTLVELLVVIALITMLMSLALPAINAAREAGRRTQCTNNIRQLALAAISHETTHGFFPSGGWGGAWVGVPGRGTGRQQPGSWGYTLLPFLERGDLFEHGATDPSPQQVAVLLQTSVAVFHCPTRRRVNTFPVFYAYARTPHGSAPVSFVARSDYAINAGDQPRCEIDLVRPAQPGRGGRPQVPLARRVGPHGHFLFAQPDWHGPFA